MNPLSISAMSAIASPMPPSNTPPRRLTSLIIWAVLVALGFLCNLFPISLFFGVVLLLGEVAIFFLAARYSLVAALVGTAIISLPTYLHWGHFWTIPVYLTEALFLHFYKRRWRSGSSQESRNLIIGLFVYWATAGWLIAYALHSEILGMPSLAAEVLALKHVLNSILAGMIYLLIDILFRYNNSHPDSLYMRYIQPAGKREFSWDINELVSFAVINIVIIPLFIAMSFYNRTQVDSIFSQQQAPLELQSLFLHQRLEGWLFANGMQDNINANIHTPELRWSPWQGESVLFTRPDESKALLFDIFIAKSLLQPGLEHAQFQNAGQYGVTLIDDSNTVVFSTMNTPARMSYRRQAVGSDEMQLFEFLTADFQAESMQDFFQNSSIAKAIEMPAVPNLRLLISTPAGKIVDQINMEYRRTMIFTLGLCLIFVLVSRFLLTDLVTPLASITEAFSRLDPANPLETLNIRWPKSSIFQFQEFTNKLSVLVWAIEGAALEREALANEMRSLIHNANSPIVGVDNAGRINVWNHKIAELTSFSWGEVEGKTLVENFVTPDVMEHTRLAFNNALDGRPTRNLDLPFLRKNGEPVELLLNISMRKNAQGHVIGLVCMGQDMTELKHAQAQLVQSSKLASVGEMATSVAHELNQPLNVIRMAAANCQRKLEKGTLDKEFLLAKLERIDQQIQRAASIINHMRMFGRNAAGEPALIDAAEAVRSAIDMVDEQFRLAQIELRTEIPDSPARILGDAIQLEQVILNLLTNARDALNDKPDLENPCVKVSVHSSHANTEIRVEDNGGGIDPRLISRIFAPFFTTKPAGKGTGLGLSISYGIIREMKGSIRAENSKAGANFIISLPTASVNKSPAETPQEE